MRYWGEKRCASCWPLAKPTSSTLLVLSERDPELLEELLIDRTSGESSLIVVLPLPVLRGKRLVRNERRPLVLTPRPLCVDLVELHRSIHRVHLQAILVFISSTCFVFLLPRSASALQVELEHFPFKAAVIAFSVCSRNVAVQPDGGRKLVQERILFVVLHFGLLEPLPLRVLEAVVVLVLRSFGHIEIQTRTLNFSPQLLFRFLDGAHVLRETAHLLCPSSLLLLLGLLLHTFLENLLLEPGRLLLALAPQPYFTVQVLPGKLLEQAGLRRLGGRLRLRFRPGRVDAVEVEALLLHAPARRRGRALAQLDRVAQRLALLRLHLLHLAVELLLLRFLRDLQVKRDFVNADGALPRVQHAGDALLVDLPAVLDPGLVALLAGEPALGLGAAHRRREAGEDCDAHSPVSVKRERRTRRLSQ